MSERALENKYVASGAEKGVKAVKLVETWGRSTLQKARAKIALRSSSAAEKKAGEEGGKLRPFSHPPTYPPTHPPMCLESRDSSSFQPPCPLPSHP